MNTYEQSDIKRRGRKPKNILDDDDQNKKVESEKKIKRGRKPKSIYNSFDVSNDVLDDSNENENDSIIIKLNVNLDKDTSPSEYSLGDNENKEIPIPYTYNQEKYYNIDQENQVIINDLPQTVNINNNLIVNLLHDFKEKNKNKEWPSNTTIACYWCTETFDNVPFGIPINYENEKFDVIDCFCSLECAASYNFAMNHNIDEMWERYNLLNLLSRKLNLENIVKPAPHRLSLKKYGGHLSKEKFREFCKSNKLININYPPMNSLTVQIEEINEFELNNDYKYIPIDNERIKRYKEKINLVREKPQVNSEHSLESSMGLTYIN